MTTPIHQTGFSLIEVLVALVLTSIGILGMVAMQGKAIAYTQDSVQRNTAAMLAEDLMELIRTNQSLYKAIAENPKLEDVSFPAAATNCASTPDLNAPDLQLGCWAAKAGEMLPGAEDLLTTKFVVCESTTPGTCSSTGSIIEIKLAWTVKSGECLDDDPDLPEDEANKCTYTLRAEL